MFLVLELTKWDYLFEGGNPEMTDFDEEMKKINKWAKESGVDQMEDEEIVVNKIEEKDSDEIVVTALVNVYMKNGDLFYADIRFNAKRKREA